MFTADLDCELRLPPVYASCFACFHGL